MRKTLLRLAPPANLPDIEQCPYHGIDSEMCARMVARALNNPDTKPQYCQIRAATRKMLWRWGNYINRTKRLEAERACAQRWAEDARNTLRATRLTGMPRGGRTSDLSDVVETVERMEQRYANLVQRIDAEIGELILLRNSMEALVAQLSPIQEKIIAYRYIDGHSWQYIAMKMNYDERHARRIECQAVDFIAEHIDVQGTR